MTHTFPIWPRRRSTAVLLTGLLVFQAAMFFVATQRSFFAQDDFYHFALADERHFFYYLVTPIIHTYPAPGHRVLFFLLHEFAPLNYLAARLVLLALLAATTILLGQLVRTLARSEAWWTVALLTPFAFSLTLVGPVNLWSNGVPVLPSLLFTVVAFSAWIRAYTAPRPVLWLAVAVAAVAAAGAFYTKFLLIPMYLLFFRLAILPPLLGLPCGLRDLWRERTRWLAVAAPPVVFLLVYVLSGLAARSYIPGERPYAEYLVTAWFGAFVPVSFLNVPLERATAPALIWPAVLASQAVFWALVAATWRRSALALRGWALLLLAFVTNMVMVGSARLPGFGVDIAYWLRYYPEVVLFVPLTLALGLTQGAERRPGLAWERSATGRVAIALFACVHALGLAVWAPRLVSQSEGAFSRAWFDNLRGDLEAARVEHDPVPLVDSETPEYVIPAWLEPRNRVSSVLRLLRVEADYNHLPASGAVWTVLDDGRLAPAVFRPMVQLVPEPDSGEHGRLSSGGTAELGGSTCYTDAAPLRFLSEEAVVGARLALRVRYAAPSRAPAALEVDTDDPDRRSRRMELRPFRRDGELLDLGTRQLRGLRMDPAPSDAVCIARLEIGTLGP
jgi:hypothetical protein